MQKNPFVRLGLLFILLTACARFTPIPTATPVPTATLQPTAVPLPKPTYAFGMFWKDVNGTNRIFMHSVPVSTDLSIEFDKSWKYQIPGTDQTLTVARYGKPQGNILVGVWTYFSQNDTSVLGDISIVAITDDGTELRDLKVKVQGQEVGTFATQQITLPKEVMGNNITIEPQGLVCIPISHGLGGQYYQTDGTSIVIAFICQPIRFPET